MARLVISTCGKDRSSVKEARIWQAQSWVEKVSVTVPVMRDILVSGE